MIIQIEITDEELACFKHDVLESPQEWLQKAWRGKINKCRGRLADQQRAKMYADPTVTTMPASEDGLIAAAFADPSYKDRATREAEAKAAEIAAAQEAEVTRK